MPTIVLLCAICAALAGGVLLAYILCSAMFHIFRIHSLQAAQQRAAHSTVSTPIASANLFVS